ncbi:hypothetical protein RJ641_031479 [Dillenia turbinata]|uniref:Retrovirus-related Pol polyprotein from transposon TNT 1-94-like beta-barrel domain-containing protein n=1 Tax=Dillenia turbinata TaxID=194707 RepID=A0AAN8VXM0_9MAGN
MKRSKSKEAIKCYYYKKTGHIKRNYRLLKQEKKDDKGKNVPDDSNATVVSSDKGIKSLVCTPSDCNHAGSLLSEWIVDTGIGDIIVETSIGYTLTLQDARHIPDMRMNLLSINVLDKEGYEGQQKNAQ